MAKEIEFCADYYGFSGRLFTVEAPDDWEEMTATEKGEWARETFWSEFEWFWGEVES